MTYYVIDIGQFEAHRRMVIVPVLLVLISTLILSAWLTFLSLREPTAGPIGMSPFFRIFGAIISYVPRRITGT